MKQLPAEKCNVAWFKLAEFVSRGEKERALNLYRLLVHSFENKAFAYQLEGDLLWSFADEQAIEKYTNAAQIYAFEQRLTEAALLYEQVLSIKSIRSIRLLLIELYLQLKNNIQLLKHLDVIINDSLLKQSYDDIEPLLDKYELVMTTEQRRNYYEQLRKHEPLYHQFNKKILLSQSAPI